MNRRQLLILAFTTILGTRSGKATARSIRAPDLATLCKNSSFIAVVDQFRTEDIRVNSFECGPKTEANVSHPILGKSIGRIAWRGMSVFREASSYVLFAKDISLQQQFEFRWGDLTEEEKSQIEAEAKAKGVRLTQNIEACSALQAELSALWALPAFQSPSGGDISVLIARDKDDLAYFAPMVEPKILSRESRGFMIGIDNFTDLVHRLSHA